MPLFEYTCRQCGHRFEALVLGARTPACPGCQSTDLEKRASSFGARTGGGGSSAPAGPFT